MSLEVVERCDAESEIDAYMSDSDPRHLPYDDSRYQIAATYLPRSGCFRVHDSGRVRDFSETEDSYQFLHTFTGKEVRDLLTTSNGRYDSSLRRVVFPSIDDCRNEVLVLNPYDQNLFFKRLRKLILEKYNEKYVTTLYQSTVDGLSVRIGTVYYSLTRTNSPRLYVSWYLRVGATVVQIVHSREDRQLVMLRRTLIALSIYQVFLTDIKKFDLDPTTLKGYRSIASFVNRPTFQKWKSCLFVF